jgi:hypothetical protein
MRHERTLCRHAICGVSRNLTEIATGRSACDARVVVTNASEDPIFNARVKLSVGDATWGSQLVPERVSDHRCGRAAGDSGKCGQ